MLFSRGQEWLSSAQEGLVSARRAPAACRAARRSTGSETRPCPGGTLPAFLGENHTVKEWQMKGTRAGNLLLLYYWPMGKASCSQHLRGSFVLLEQGMTLFIVMTMTMPFSMTLCLAQGACRHRHSSCRPFSFCTRWDRHSYRRQKKDCCGKGRP